MPAGERVKISTPVSVTATICSNWADRDRSLSAQFEHMVAVTDTGVEIFTLSPAGMHKPPYGA